LVESVVIAPVETKKKKGAVPLNSKKKIKGEKSTLSS
jgi:hypothetical protein